MKDRTVRNTPLIDPHHHLYDLENNYYPWLMDNIKPGAMGDYRAICKSYLLEDYLEDAKNQNLVKSVHLDVGWDPADPAGETAWLQKVADKHGFPHGIVGYADLTRPDVEDLLDRHMESPNFRGIRQSLNYHPDPVMTWWAAPGVSRTAEWRRGYALLGKKNLSFDLQIYPSQMEASYDLAKTFPDIQILLNHTGMNLFGMEHFGEWEKGMRVLAQAPNAACKISGLGMGDFNWTVDSIRPYVLTAIDIFGVDRCMFASNFSVDKLYSSYDAVFNAFKEITADFSDSEALKLFHDNAERYYRL